MFSTILKRTPISLTNIQEKTPIYNSQDSLTNLSSTNASENRKSNKDIQDLMKKMRILKDGVLRERQDKEAAIKLNTELTVELEKIKAQVQERDTINLKLRTENIELQDQIQLQKKRTQNLEQKVNNPEPSTTSTLTNVLGISSIFGKKTVSNDEYQKVLNENNYVKKQLESIFEKLNKAELNTEQFKKELKNQAEIHQKKLAEMDKIIEDKTHAFIEMSHKNQDLQSNIKRMEEEMKRTEETINRARKELDSTMTERDNLEKLNIERIKMINELNDICKAMEIEIMALTDSNRKAVEDLEESELQLQVYNAKKINKVLDTPAQLLLRKNLTGDHILEIENPNERIVIYPDNIQTFGPVKETEDKIYIEYKMANNQVYKDTYALNNRKKLLKNLKALVQRLEDNKESNTERKVTVVQNQKNLFSQVVSFFGN